MLLAALEVDERGHGADGVFLGDLRVVVCVYAGEGEGVFARVGGGEVFIDGRDGFAGAAPVGVDWYLLVRIAYCMLFILEMLMCASDEEDWT